jgi:hypothetical protein
MWKSDKEWFMWWEEFYTLAKAYKESPLGPEDRVSPEYAALGRFVAKALDEANTFIN